MTLLVGITGGIGSGKSTFSKQVLKNNFKLFDSDKEVALLYKKPKLDFLNYLKKIGLGDSIKGKRINKKIIRDIIFTNKKIKLDLEKYIFKIVRKLRKDFIKKHKKDKTRIIFFDIPLLFENNLSKEFDLIITIIANKKERLKRLKITKELFKKIIINQTSDLVRKEKSDILIYNNAELEKYIKKINKVLEEFVK